MVSIDMKIFLPQLITFLVALPLIYMFFLKPLIKTLKDRDEAIQRGIDAAEKGKADVEVLKAEYEQKVKEMESKSKEAVTLAISEGEKAKTKLIEEAKSEGQKLVQDAKKEIEIEKVKAIEEVKDKIVDLSIMAAEVIIKKKLNKKEQVGIVEKYMKEIEKRVN